ncbi:MAG: hypothetical protein V4581_10060 [Bacteroidota bacterium]
MKFLVYAIALLCTAAGFSQGLDGAYFSYNGSILVYNNDRDTIFLSKMSSDSILLSPLPCRCRPELLMRLGSGVATQIFKEIQVDGQRAREVVIKRAYSEVIFGHGGSYDTTVNEIFSVYEIWNLDSKEMLFRSVSDYDNKYDCFCAEGSADRKTAKGERSYSYDIAIDDKGTITITNLNLKGGDDFPFRPDHQEGVYIFKDGKYSKQ